MVALLVTLVSAKSMVWLFFLYSQLSTDGGNSVKELAHGIRVTHVALCAASSMDQEMLILFLSGIPLVMQAQHLSLRSIFFEFVSGASSEEEEKLILKIHTFRNTSD